MEFHEKLQRLRKQKGLTQEELAQKLLASRTAISKWESARGYPGIDSLKRIAAYFDVPIDALLSGRELPGDPKQDAKQKRTYVGDIAFGAIDCAAAFFFLLPLFAQRRGNVFFDVTLWRLTDLMWYTKSAYLVLIALTVLCGVCTLALQNALFPF